MNPSKKQNIARQANWALYQIKGARGNLTRALRWAGVDSEWVDCVLCELEADVIKERKRRMEEVDKEQRKSKWSEDYKS